MPPRADGEGVYGGRDALHIAISDNDGATWQGFREIYLDHRRNENPARSGDRGTAYPLAAFTEDGQIAVIAGQGKGGRNVILIDPDWVTADRAASDFSGGLHGWSVYTHHGPARRWWRARAVGCRLVPGPNGEDRPCLHVHNPEDLPAAGGTWNFPNGWAGTLSTRVMLRDGCRGGSIGLTDRMFDPASDLGEQLAVFRLDIDGDGRLGTAQLQPQRWYDVTLQWDLSGDVCELTVDGQPAGSIPLLNPTLNGISYVRFRAAREQDDPSGFLVEHVRVKLHDREAPRVTPEQLLEQEQRYLATVVPTWQD